MGLGRDILRVFGLGYGSLADAPIARPQTILDPVDAPGGDGAGADAARGGAGPDASLATETDVAMMRRALELARAAADVGEVPVGAVVYETATGRVLGEAFNRREIDKDPTAHAELLAMRGACAAKHDWRLTDCTVVVTLEPCPMCAGVIVNARVGRLVYGAADPKAGACGSLMALTNDARLNHRVVPVEGVLAEECAALLKSFFASLRRPDRPKKPDSSVPRL
ncbi:MAG: tRNA adenosine(34) deaminase TadA [Phycisphaeraceae bacterium]|nr:MAG: tRNA adenosine(34) deaminase TadA [Phycisphaeraceae bacterium]